jgi:hypothetical protein
MRVSVQPDSAASAEFVLLASCLDPDEVRAATELWAAIISDGLR